MIDRPLNFEQTHQTGTEEFGVSWYRVHRTVADLLPDWYIGCKILMHKTLIGFVVLITMRVMQKIHEQQINSLRELMKESNEHIRQDPRSTGKGHRESPQERIQKHRA